MKSWKGKTKRLRFRVDRCRKRQRQWRSTQKRTTPNKRRWCFPAAVPLSRLVVSISIKLMTKDHPLSASLVVWRAEPCLPPSYPTLPDRLCRPVPANLWRPKNWTRRRRSDRARYWLSFYCFRNMFMLYFSLALQSCLWPITSDWTSSVPTNDRLLNDSSILLNKIRLNKMEWSLIRENELTDWIFMNRIFLKHCLWWVEAGRRRGGTARTAKGYLRWCHQ